MKGFIALLRKEVKEELRTNKVLSVVAMFLFLGLFAPVLARYLPEFLLDALSGTEGVVVEMPDPVSNDALLRYASNISQLGVFITVLISMGAFTKEIESGTASLILSKPVSRMAFITSKIVARGFNLLCGLFLGSLVCFVTTYLLFEDVYILGFVGQMALMLMYLLFCLVVTLFFSSFGKHQLAAGGASLIVIIVLSLPFYSFVPKIGKFFPGGLLSWGNQLVLSQTGYSGWVTMIVTLLLLVLLVYGSWLNMRRKEL